MQKPLLFCKWALMILVHLFERPKRPSELKREIQGITDKILHERLNILAHMGYLQKSSNNKYPLEVYYSLKYDTFVNDLIGIINRLPLSIENFVDIISKKWTFEIMEILNTEKSPKEILTKLVGLSERILYQRLSQLELLDLVRRKVYSSKPVSVTYELTQEGKRALPVFRRALSIILSR